MSSLSFEAPTQLQSAAPLHEVKVYRIMQASAEEACLEQSQLREMSILWHRFFLELPILSLSWAMALLLLSQPSSIIWTHYKEKQENSVGEITW